MKLYGVIDKGAKFLQNDVLCDRKLWAKFVDQFRVQIDGENHAWRGEYWGKMMRGASYVYAYTKDEILYDILTEMVVIY